MNIALLTNTFAPHVGGVARSVESFAAEYRRLGHEVLVVAPEFEGAPEREEGVVRVPAIVHFNGSDFSVPMPVPGRVAAAFERFRPEIVHSHHPFLLGDTALRLAAAQDLPVVFTHHTLYERYTHYVPGDSPAMRRFAIELAVGYCNLCDAVIAPSRSVEALLRQRGVTVPIRAIPTGVDLTRFAGGDGAAFRRAAGIPAAAVVVGHVGRLAAEKNLVFLARSLGRFMAERPTARFLLVGGGPALETVRGELLAAGVADRLHVAGVLGGEALVSAYRAMDAFAFASHSETQGMVLAEAMAAGVPVVAVDAYGVREVVRDGVNGRLLPRDDETEFAAALGEVADLPAAGRGRLAAGIAETARELSLERTARDTLELYRLLRLARPSRKELEGSAWAGARRRLAEEWRILRNVAAAAGRAERRPWQARLLALLWSLAFRLQLATWRKDVHGLENLDGLIARRVPVVAAFWHGKYTPLFALLRGREAVVFTSLSFRGGVIAEICRRFGYRPVQLADRGGEESYERMRRELAGAGVCGIALDGPLGPYHRVKRGPIRLASELGLRIVPITFAARRSRVATNRWDRMEVPRLFSRVVFLLGTAVEVPAGLDEPGIRDQAAALEDLLEDLDRRAAELL